MVYMFNLIVIVGYLIILILNFVIRKYIILTYLNYMNTLGFGYNLVAFNCLLNGLGKVGYIDHALRLFKVMEVKDSFTYTIVVHNLCRAKQFLCASKVLVSCLKCGYQVLRATQREVIVCLQSIGYANEARRVKSRIRLAQFVP